MGNAMILIQADIDAIMEATRPAPKKPPAVRRNDSGNPLEEAGRKLRALKEQRTTKKR
jgi:hypothetical protein